MKAESVFIDKHSLVDPCSFDALKKQGLLKVQELSGHVWTDYNVHDPGVTILEQLCFVLSDVSYRAGADVTDYLGENTVKQLLNRSSLLAPEDAFPCHATTLMDLKQIILDAVPELDNIHIETIGEQPYRFGLYNVYISISPLAKIENSDIEKSALKHRVLACYGANRNLCENINEIHISEDVPFTIEAEIEVDDSNNSAEVLANIYLNCTHKIANQISSSKASEDTKELSLQQSLIGPSVIHERQHYDISHKTIIPVFEFYAVINEISEVKAIKSLSFFDKKGNRVDALSVENYKQHIRLTLPDSSEGIKINLVANGRIIPTNFSNYQMKYHELITEHFSNKYHKRQFDDFSKKTKSKELYLTQYSGLQDQFPANYGINFRGIPISYTAQRRAQAFQLKGYLAIFEQIILNQIHKIDEIRYLFSPLLHVHKDPTSVFLNNNIIPDFDQIKNENYEQKLMEQDGRFSSFYRRANKVVDYLLALYGEEFGQYIFQQYGTNNGNKITDRIAYEHKLRLLSHIGKVTKNRLKATDVTQFAWNTDNISGWQLKVSILLGFGCLKLQSLSFGVFRNDVNIDFAQDHESKDKLDSALSESFFDFHIDTEDIYQHFHALPYQAIKQVTLTSINKYFPLKFTCKEKPISQRFLQSATNIENYKIGRFTQGNSDISAIESFEDLSHIAFYDQEENSHFSIGSFQDLATAITAANTLISYFQSISKQSEGMHIIEHSLLAQYSDVEQLKENYPISFFGSRVTVILPNWTAKTSTRTFQKLAEETIAMHCPAHIYPMFLWLDLRRMYHLEVRYRKWLKAIATNDVDVKQTNKLTQQLLHFIYHLHISEERGVNEQ
ncbi:hypothetical protein [Thalassotalea atypica]|uniref:hypothetical protein n=1 Tax=Thalassotalea atypica TaxID=2054316 RepID=UPI002573DCAD|nr:hypothetical protein [Thalassotalea atypica]